MGLGDGSEEVVQSVQSRGWVAKSGKKWGGTRAWWRKGERRVPEWSSKCREGLLGLYEGGLVADARKRRGRGKEKVEGGRRRKGSGRKGARGRKGHRHGDDLRRR